MPLVINVNHDFWPISPSEDFCDNEPMKLKFPTISLSEFAAVGTWAVVVGVSFYFVSIHGESLQTNVPWMIVFYILYIVCFVSLVRETAITHIPGVVYSLVVVMLLCVFALAFTAPFDFFAILSIIWVSVLPHFFSLRRSLFIMVIVVLSWYSLFAWLWDKHNVYIQGLLFLTFHFFAIMMSHNTQMAEKATEESLRLNKELQSAQQLLAEASKQNERTRIARDLHDLLGHHLTALIINLQVAQHLTQGEAKEKVEQCHSLAKLLLSDVREAVTTLRENESLDFPTMVNILADNTPQLSVHSEIDAQIQLEDLTLAKGILSIIQESITNSLRHSGAENFWVVLTEVQNELNLTLHDDGRIKGELKEGNGLRGIKERVAEFGGQVNIEQMSKNLKLSITIPHTLVSEK